MTFSVRFRVLLDYSGLHTELICTVHDQVGLVGPLCSDKERDIVVGGGHYVSQS